MTRVTAACFAVPFGLIRLHLGRVVAAFRHADGRAHAVADEGLGEIESVFVTLDLAELHELLGFGSKNKLHGTPPR